MSDTQSTVPQKKSPIEIALKWVAALTAVLSLIFGMQKLIESLASSRARTEEITRLLATAKSQQGSRDYAGAWDSVEAANRSAQQGGVLARLMGHQDADIVRVRTARIDLGMRWLDDMTLDGRQTFSQVVAPITAVLERGLVDETGARRADVMAHIGWSYFLRSRDGNPQFDPTASYREAIAIDAHNPFAHAYWGHLIAWRGGELGAVRERFALALRANREREWVRHYQFSAYRNRSSDGEPYIVEMAAEMLRNKEPVPEPMQQATLRTLRQSCAATRIAEETRGALRKVVTGDALNMMFVAFDPRPDSDPQRIACAKALHEAV